MLKRCLTTALFLSTTFALAGCSSQDVPQAHKGRIFDKTGVLALYAGGDGFKGPILGPGTYYTGIYPEVRMVNCGQRTTKEPLTALTKDGVQFSLDIYVRFSANCDEGKAVEQLLSTLSPAGAPSKPAADAKPDPNVDPEPVELEPTLTIGSTQIYTTFIRPALGEAVREAVSGYIANEVNAKRDEVFEKIKSKFAEYVSKAIAKEDGTKLVLIHSINLSNLDFPDQLEKANVDRATQAVLKDKALAEQEKIKAEIETAKLEVTRAEVEAQAKAKKIDIEGAALKRNPEYYIRDVYYYAADKGGSVMLPGDPNVILQITPKK